MSDQIGEGIQGVLQLSVRVRYAEGCVRIRCEASSAPGDYTLAVRKKECTARTVNVKLTFGSSMQQLGVSSLQCGA
jgi:hypothetical protein